MPQEIKPIRLTDASVICFQNDNSLYVDTIYPSPETAQFYVDYNKRTLSNYDENPLVVFPLETYIMMCIDSAYQIGKYEGPEKNMEHCLDNNDSESEN